MGKTVVRSSTTNARVTVLMPVFNGEFHLRDAVDSILRQTYGDFELLIINDGSTDKSVAVIESYADKRIRLIHNKENIGLIATLNRGLELAQGEYIARMDCDDISYPQRLARQVEFMDAHPEIGISGTWVETIGEVTGVVWKYPTEPDLIRSQLLFDSPLAHPSVILRKKLFDLHQLRYDPQYEHAEDWELWQRSSKYFSLANIPKLLTKYRISRKSTSRVNEQRQLQTIRLIDIQNLNDLGLTVTPEEADLHRRLGTHQFSSETTFIDSAEDWLCKLRSANALTRVYPETAFSKVVSERWLYLCGAAADRGCWTWRRYWRSPLSRRIEPALRGMFKLAVKCLIKYKKTDEKYIAYS